jgi:hypothetical protein
MQSRPLAKGSGTIPKSAFGVLRGESARTFRELLCTFYGSCVDGLQTWLIQPSRTSNYTDCIFWNFRMIKIACFGRFSVSNQHTLRNPPGPGVLICTTTKRKQKNRNLTVWQRQRRAFQSHVLVHSRDARMAPLLPAHMLTYVRRIPRSILQSESIY